MGNDLNFETLARFSSFAVGAPGKRTALPRTPTGAFRKVISMTREGINTVVVRAVDGAGNRSTISRGQAAGDTFAQLP